MTESFKGSWPGGPRREQDAPKRAHAPRLERMDELEARAASWSLRKRRKARRGRTRTALVVTVVVAGVVGWVMGLLSHPTLEDMAQAQTASRQRDADVSAEINRVLLELWRMEDTEYQRNRR